MSISGRPLHLLAVALATAGILISVSVGAEPAAAVVLSVSPTGTFHVVERGNGHGHGMSQYGARGAALAGRTYQQILAFYYPGTTLATLPRSTIWVKLSGAGATTTVAANSLVSVTGIVGVLPSAGVAKYRLVASGGGLALQQLRSAAGSGWRTYRAGLANRAEFRNPHWAPVRLYRSDGTSTTYHGALRAVRTSSGVYTVNRLEFDEYTAGVVPRESPASWPVQSLYAQAVAARSYARYEVDHAGSGGEYDICDTSSCQVYGGQEHYDRHGNLLWSDLPSVVLATAHKVLRYHGSTIFAQFAASNGGWSVDGGQPYLVAKPDPYDAAASGDPYLLYSTPVSVASVGRYFGIPKVTSIGITRRDGHGPWGGRATAGYVSGLDARGQATRVDVSGSDLQWAFGVGTTWLTLQR
ncbi:MAG: SpoIID/LytB domain-containing protein [Actinomycetota bacterium]|nr:SpoIID/LytB domain-containing protein [Actinomycetota bacterium]